MLVVSDTTAVSNLLQINALELLHQIYGRVVMPTAVKEELLVLEELGFPIQATLALPWIEVKSLGNTSLYVSLLEELDKGEAESIVLAVELQADYLLIDEKKGRQIARNNSLPIIGTLGVIIEGKRRGHVSSVQNTMDELKGIGFWINENLYQQIVEIEKNL